MTRPPVFSQPIGARALRLLAASLILTACSTSSSTQPTDDAGVRPDGGGSPDGGAPDGGTLDGAPVIESFSADPLGLLVGGGTATLSWQVVDANTLSIDQGIGTVSGESTTVEVTETTRFTLTATNDKGTATRSTSVIVGSTTPVAFRWTDPDNSIAAIDRALSENAIDDVDALRYKVFALFDDPRLPAQFDLEGNIHGSPIMFELARRFAQLPAEVKEELRPFMIPPDEPGSWYQGFESVPSQILKGSPGVYDRQIDVAGGRVRVLWESAFAERDQEWFRSVLAPMLEGAYEKLRALMGRPPIPHTGNQSEPFRVFLVNKPQFKFKWVGLTTAQAFDSALGGRPAHIQINLPALSVDNNTYDSFTQAAAAAGAHELMHAFQFAFDTIDSGTQALDWLFESTATWAEHHVYRSFNTEHPFAEDYLLAPGSYLDDLSGDHEYGGYLFPLFLEETLPSGASTIPQIWKNAEFSETLTAVVLAAGGELYELWPKFTAYNWNREPLKFHQTWDGMSRAVAEGVTKARVALSSEQQVYEMDLWGPSARGPLIGVDYLAARYYHFDLTDPGLHTILFANGFSFKLEEGTPEIAPSDVTLFATELTNAERDGRHVYVLVKAEGKWLPDAVDITDVAFIPFCQDYMEERIEELVFIFSNSRWLEIDRELPLTPEGLSPRLFVSNFSCGDWVGSASSTKVDNSGSRSETTVVNYENLVFTRARLSHEGLLEGDGELNLGDTIIPYDASPLSAFRYESDIVDVAWEIDGFYTSGDNECIVIGEGMMTADDVFLSLFDVRPPLVGPTNDPGSVYRSFAANIILQAPGFPVLEDCSQTGSAMVPFMTEFGGANRNLEFGTLEISSDGVSINESWEIGDATFTLDLLGIADPPPVPAPQP